MMEAYFETVKTNPDIRAKRKTVPVLLEGEWDGEKFVHISEQGFETIVRKKEWILFEKPEKFK
jgi:hypothetical protein